MATKAYQSAVAFFYEHAGYSYGPGETREQGRKRGARRLADAERWLMEQPGHTIQWVQDEDYNPADYDCGDMPEIGWGCVITVNGHIESLWSITFNGDGYPSGNAYARVVVAELALELMPS